MTLHTVLTDYKTQMFIIIIFPLQPMFCSQSSRNAVYSLYLSIYLSSLALNTTLTETLNSTVLVLDSFQSPSPFNLTQQERIPQNMTNDSKLAHSVESVVQTIFILLLMSLSMKFNITKEWPVSTTLLIKVTIDAPVHLPTPSNINI